MLDPFRLHSAHWIGKMAGQGRWPKRTKKLEKRWQALLRAFRVSTDCYQTNLP
jgi:hypothetical protein